MDATAVVGVVTMTFEPGAKVIVCGQLPVFTDEGLRFEPDYREATFIEHTPKPYDPEACRVDYGNGVRKCTTTILILAEEFVQ